MNNHNCPGLFQCRNHPRWHVIYVSGRWSVYRPGPCFAVDFPTHAEAINYAQKEATK